VCERTCYLVNNEICFTFENDDIVVFETIEHIRQAETIVVTDPIVPVKNNEL
jgi:hypothetical protein